MALLPDAIEQTVDDMVENCWVSPTDPIANIYGLLDEAASTGVSLDSECRDMSRASEALEPQDRNANELEGEMDR